MEILKIRRSRNRDTGLKIYADVLGDSGKTYKVGYIRRPNFRGWICSCENFMLSMFAKKRNCKHIRHVRETYGRFGTRVPRTTATS